MRRTHIMVWIICGLCCFMPINGVAATPHQTLEAIGEAVNNGDSETFSRLVDVDGVLQQALDTFIEGTSDPALREQLPAVMTMLLTQLSDPGQTGTALRNMLLSESRAFILNGVSSGAFAGKKMKSSPATGLLAPIFSNMSTGRKEIRGVGDASPDGDSMILPFYIHDYGNEQDYGIVARFIPLGDDWQLARLENMEDLFVQLLNEASQ